MAPEKEGLLAKELGTMGIPREVAAFRNESNFLFQGGNKIGPGDYNPEKPRATVPSSNFGMDKAPGRVPVDKYQERIE